MQRLATHRLENFFGFKLHLVIDLNGNIINASITPANVDDRGVIETI